MKPRAPKDNAGARAHESAALVTRARPLPTFMVDPATLPKKPPTRPRERREKAERA